MEWQGGLNGPWSPQLFVSDQSPVHCPAAKSDTSKNFHLDLEGKSAAGKEKRAVRKTFKEYLWDYTIKFRQDDYLHKCKRKLINSVHPFFHIREKFETWMLTK